MPERNPRIINPCKQGKELSVLSSGAGYYIGTCDEEGPFCRISLYYDDGNKAKEDLRAYLQDDKQFITRDCMESQYCGCTIGGRYPGKA